MSEAAAPYRVLARKYRPKDFAGLIGQEAMVRTLSNAIEAGRLAHAFVLTGVRGVGKTTTARIIARALNCIGPDGTGGPTIQPCGTCVHCQAIAEDRHVDIMEMDAASRTGVNDIREIIESVRYRPTSARFKIYIIDEVHMLSTQAFNALLKTLEEPPEHVKFIFATTEIRKIPVTVLSRCQRFDLRRVDIAVLTEHFAAIADKEGAKVEPEALAMIARAADGSVRDGLSLLDQAISFGAGLVTETQVRDMLGLADRAAVFDLFGSVMKGDIRAALAAIAEQYAQGADPSVVLQDMLELTHWLTRLKLTPDAARSGTVSETERVKGAEMAEKLSMAQLSRTWQMLLKGLAETRSAPNPLQAAEMALVRLAYAADLPTPAEVIERLGDTRGQARNAAPASGGGETGTPMTLSPRIQAGTDPGPGAPRAALNLAPKMEATTEALPRMPTSFAEVVALCAEKREAILASQLKREARLVRFQPGKIELRIADGRSQPDLTAKLGRMLAEWTGRSWIVALNSVDPAEATLAEQEVAAETRRRADAAEDPLVKAILNAFPGAAIEAVREAAEAEADNDDVLEDQDLTPGEEES